MSVEILITGIMGFLTLLYASWFVIAAFPRGDFRKSRTPSLSIIVPAYNEAANIANTIDSITSASYPGRKEIIVVDDGSKDGTGKIVKNLAKTMKNLRLVETRHVGKAKAVNAAVRSAKGEILAVLDADTEIDQNALMEIVKPFSERNVAAVSTTVRVKTTGNPLSWIQEFEYAISSGWRYVADNIRASCVVPGFCAFRKSMLVDVGGMKGDTAVEDYDICMYLKKAGYNIRMAPKSIAYTVVPETARGLITQRVRWARGTLQMLRKHHDVILNKKYSAVGLYSVPVQTYWFLHALVYMPVVLYQMVGGYFQWFASRGDFFSTDAIMYFVKWMTAYGTADFLYNFGVSNYPFTVLNLLTACVIFLSFGFGVYSLLKFSRRSPKSLLGLFFFFPYTLIILGIHVYSTIYQLLERDRGERWEKVQ